MISKKIQLLCGIALSIGAFADTINGSKTFFQDYLETKLKLDTQDHHLHQVRELLLGPWMSSFFEHCKDPSMQKKMSEFIINFENAYFNYFTLENSESFNPEPLATYSLLVHLMSRLENENAFQFDKIGAKDLAFIENILRQVEANQMLRRWTNG